MSSHGQRSRPAAEWIALALSLLVVGTLIAFAAREEAFRQNEPGTSLAVEFAGEASQVVEGSYYVPYVVENTGASAISSAEIWIEVFAGQSLVESAEIQVEFLPLQGKQHGIYVSKFDPQTHTLRGRLESLQFP